MSNYDKIMDSFFCLVSKAKDEGIASAELFASVSGQRLTVNKAGAIDRFLHDCAAEFRNDEVIANVVVALREQSPVVAQSLVEVHDEDGEVVGFLNCELQV